MPTENINNINTNDITSYEILKDFGLAIYGTRAANGVIIIIRPKGTGVTVEVESFAGVRAPLKTVKWQEVTSTLTSNSA
jgi:hypothetical protein